MKKNLKPIISSLFIYILSSTISFFIFRATASTQIASIPADLPLADGEIAIHPDAPRTETCPLNGALYTVTEKDIWDQRRPLTMMVENSVEARPHSGLVRADVVYEAIAEGGVTRFMAVFLCDAARSNVVVAPIRSARAYYIDWASEYGETPLYGHVLGANCSAEKLPSGSYGPCKSDPRAQALEILSKIGWRYAKGNDLDQAAIGAPTYRRNEARLFSLTGQNVATEHSVEGRTTLLYDVAANRGWTDKDPEGTSWLDSFRPWKFKDFNPDQDRGSTTSITYDFWSGYKQFDVLWQYQAESNTYLRQTGGEPHLDLETGQQLSVTNVVVQFTKEIGPVDELKHMLYTTIGEGDALIFQNGQAIEGYWKKKSRLDRTLFYTKKGQEIEFTRGKIWLSIVSDQTEVNYQ